MQSKYANSTAMRESSSVGVIVETNMVLDRVFHLGHNGAKFLPASQLTLADLHAIAWHKVYLHALVCCKVFRSIVLRHEAVSMTQHVLRNGMPATFTCSGGSAVEQG